MSRCRDGALDQIHNVLMCTNNGTSPSGCTLTAGCNERSFEDLQVSEEAHKTVKHGAQRFGPCILTTCDTLLAKAFRAFFCSRGGSLINE